MAKKATKAAPKKKGPDNNKRLAELEARELRRDYPTAFQNGQRAARSNISEDQMPVLYGRERDAWLAGNKGR